jgi:hypothetical protein
MQNKYLRKKYSMTLFVIVSLMTHLAVLYALVLSGPLTLSLPLHPLPAVMVTLKDVDAAPPKQAKASGTVANVPDRQPPDRLNVPQKIYNNPTESVVPSTLQTESAPAQGTAETALTKDEKTLQEDSGKNQYSDGPKKGPTESPADGHVPVTLDYKKFKGPVRKAGEFLAARKETLTYRISVLKVPVGTAVMEASNKDGELKITIKITSNAFFSTIYPVDDLVETRMIKGNYLLTRVRQSEGSYRGDFGFTLMLREHQAFWVDRLTNRFNYQPLPVDDVMDAVSGFYFLRNQDLKVGKEVQLNLFDSNEYSPTTVEVLRRERIGLPGGRELDTLVLHPLFKTAGFFRRTGDVMIWLSDDKFRVPARMETFITLGKVTAELVSAESEQEENGTGVKLPGNSADKSGR